MKRGDAVLIAEDLVNELVALCEKIEIAGSIRRCRENVNDIDLVCIPKFMHLDAVKERLELIDEATHGLLFMRITSFDGLLIDLVHREQADCIVRGLRAISDFEYEFQMALMNRKLRQTVETVFMMPHEKYTYISSRLIKEVASLGAPVAGLVPPLVEERLAQKFSRK